MLRKSDDAMVFVFGSLVGIVTGVIAGIMFSPKPGLEVRQEIKTMAEKVRTKMPYDREKTKQICTEAINKVKNTVEIQLNKINEAIKASKLAEAKKKEELKSGY